jgi:hypothetical protein
MKSIYLKIPHVKSKKCNKMLYNLSISSSYNNNIYVEQRTTVLEYCLKVNDCL